MRSSGGIAMGTSTETWEDVPKKPRVVYGNWEGQAVDTWTAPYIRRRERQRRSSVTSWRTVQRRALDSGSSGDYPTWPTCAPPRVSSCLPSASSPPAFHSPPPPTPTPLIPRWLHLAAALPPSCSSAPASCSSCRRRAAPPAARSTTKRLPGTANTEQPLTGARTACVPRVPARPAVGTGGLRASVAREPSVPAGFVEDVRPSTANVALLPSASPSIATPHPPCRPSSIPSTGRPEGIHQRTFIAVHGHGSPSQSHVTKSPLGMFSLAKLPVPRQMLVVQGV
ncbi:hypothetical protein E2C01_029124 [Portunus trituberculatus]|uniref:Uncharacterized protein n=1 Tax=Portunus trituberculatus TaxID=210409 RepID=A0A5B7ENB9_PORTR|nr:hypothetical protein [Portunus trituberculatus]